MVCNTFHLYQINCSSHCTWPCGDFNNIPINRSALFHCAIMIFLTIRQDIENIFFVCLQPTIAVELSSGDFGSPSTPSASASCTAPVCCHSLLLLLLRFTSDRLPNHFHTTEVTPFLHSGASISITCLEPYLYVVCTETLKIAPFHTAYS